MISDIDFLIKRFSVGSVSLGDIEVLIHFAKGLEVVVELGTNIGTTSVLLSAVAGKVFTVDVFENTDLIEDEKQKETYAKAFRNNKHHYGVIAKKLAYFKVDVSQGLSHELADAFGPESVDMVFIDGDHSYNGVKRDFDAWFDKIKTGGYFAFHDCVKSFPVYQYKKEVLDHDERISIVSDKLRIDSPTLTSTVVYEKRHC
jgi:predicted O-methyltransferase YrrM